MTRVAPGPALSCCRSLGEFLPYSGPLLSHLWNQRVVFTLDYAIDWRLLLDEKDNLSTPINPVEIQPSGAADSSHLASRAYPSRT